VKSFAAFKAMSSRSEEDNPQDTPLSASEVRATLTHPVIDVDGHILEFLPALDEYLRQAMGSRVFETWLQKRTATVTAEERQKLRQPQPGWWTGAPVTQPLDRAAAMLPRLLRSRMDQFGIDFMILYTSVGLGSIVEPDEEVRRPFCWALNEFYSDHYLAHGDRFTPAGVVPMYSPEEALNEIDHCHSLGLKVIQLPHGIPRPIPKVHASDPTLYPDIHWLDTYGLDSLFNYDIVWDRLQELGFAATFHGHSSNAAAMKTSRSVTNYVFNHLGAHASLLFELCKSLVLGGVTRRFPRLHMAFLEGGVHWAQGLLHDLIEHWEKRNPESIAQYDPRLLNVETMKTLLQQWGRGLVDQSNIPSSAVFANRRESSAGDLAENGCPDDFANCGIRNCADIPRLFKNLYFGCEADDAAICGPNGGYELPLKAMFSSDFGHWDTVRADKLLPEVYKLMNSGVLSPSDFQSFTANNAIQLHGTTNPGFWKGTSVEQYAQKVLST
jgi:predicted TIM-barrel fold metal-dependent hydrolase